VITTARAGRVLKAIRAEGAVEQARCELAAAFLDDLRRIDAQLRETKKQLAAVVAATGTSLTGLFGVGPVIAAAVIGDVRDVSRFPGRDHFAAYNGTAPIEVSSGPRKVYRLSRRGNRRLNHAIHMAAITQIRQRHSKGRAYYEKKLAEGKTAKEALRALKRQVSNAIFACLRPARRSPREGPGRAAGERLCRQRGRLAPQAPALRTSHSRAWAPHYDRGRQPGAWACRCPWQGWPFLDRCQSAAGAAAGPGGAPAAKRGRTTWTGGKTTATLGREEGRGSRIAGKTTAPEGHLISPRARPTGPLDTKRHSIWRQSGWYRAAVCWSPNRMLGAPRPATGLGRGGATSLSERVNASARRHTKAVERPLDQVPELRLQQPELR